MSALTVLVGHRGVGKTSLLRRIMKYVPEARVYCLDEEIEKQVGSIKDFFSLNGELAFRQIENKTFKDIIEKNKSTDSPLYIAVGGGFAGEIPEEARCLWIKRDWDISQNIYFDRPSLNPDPLDLRIPQSLFLQREEKLRQQGFEELTLPEGVFTTHPGEKKFFLNQPAGGAVTLLPEHFRRDRLQRLLQLSPRWVELRDDLLTAEQMKSAFQHIPQEKILLSFRDFEREQETLSFVPQAALVDWPYERGDFPSSGGSISKIFSVHSDEDHFFEAFEIVSGIEGRVKWSPFVSNVEQLKLGHEWMCRKQEERVFLPRSENGRWYWYRHLQKNKMFLNFWREGFGSSLDQPTLLQWLQPTQQKFFSAVLGQPVLQSWSPSFHADFWAQKNTAMYAIELSQDELNHGGFRFLSDLGLCAAAVTSPLKQWAAESVQLSQPINTLYKDEKGGWQGQSTDAAGFTEMLLQANVDLAEKKIVVWGGQGVLASLPLPQASFYSARNGQPKVGSLAVEQPDLLIWAAGFMKGADVPSAWRPSLIMDLNYRADSPAKSYAHQIKAKYISGDIMFFKQATEQQKIWSSYEWC